MAKLQDLANQATQITRDTDFLYGARALGTSPETYQDVRIPANVLDVGTIYDFGFSFSGTPAAGQTLGRVLVGQKLLIPAAFTGAFGRVQTSPAAQFDILMSEQSVASPATQTIATISISTGGVFTFTPAVGSPPSDITIPAGSLILFTAPAGSPADASIVDIDAVIGSRIVL